MELPIMLLLLRRVERTLMEYSMVHACQTMSITVDTERLTVQDHRHRRRMHLTPHMLGGAGAHGTPMRTSAHDDTHASMHVYTVGYRETLRDSAG